MPYSNWIKQKKYNQMHKGERALCGWRKSGIFFCTTKNLGVDSLLVCWPFLSVLHRKSLYAPDEEESLRTF